MADMWIRITDQTDPDPDLDTGLTKRGDVITIQADGWPWSDFEKSLIDHMLLSVDGDVSELIAFLEPEASPDPYYAVRPRMSYFDVDSLQAALFGESVPVFVGRETIQQRIYEEYGDSMSVATALSYRVEKSPTPPPGTF